MLTRIKQDIREQISVAENKLFTGQFSDYTGAMVLVERRKTLVGAIETINTITKGIEDDEDFK